jgi:tetratricopeptide (TPR) repeat protein
MKKYLLSFVLVAALSTQAFAKQKLIENSFLINPDVAGSASGQTALRFNSPSSFFYNPSSNFLLFDDSVFASGYSAYGDIGGGVGGYVMPTGIGNFGFALGYNSYYPSSANLSSFGAYINYVYPLVTSVPVTTYLGGIGATVKLAYFNDEDESALSAAFDLALTYNLSMLLKGLWAGAAVRNIGSDLDIGSYTAELPTNFAVFTRYEFKDKYLSALNVDIVKLLSISNIGVAAGAEITPISPLTLRAGYRDFGDNINAGPTAGFGINMAAVTLGYAFNYMQHNAGNSHILQLSIALGKSADDKKAYEYYLGLHLEEAKATFDKGDYITARAQFENILAIYPDDAVSKNYLKRIAEGMDTLDRDVSIQTERLLRRAEVANLRNDFVTARNYYEQVLEIDPENNTARYAIEDIDGRLEAIKQDNAYAKKEHEIVTLWESAMDDYNNARFIFAKEKFEKILTLDPQNQAAKEYLEKTSAQTDKTNEINAETLFQQGLEFYNMADFAKAAKLFDAAYLTDRSRLDARDYAVLAAQAARGESGNTAQDLAEEEAIINAAPQTDKARVVTSNQRIASEMNAAFVKAQNLFDTGDYEKALSAFIKVRELAVKNRYYDLNTKIRLYTTRSKSAISDKFFNESLTLSRQANKLEEAYALVEKALEYNPENAPAKMEAKRLKDIIAQKYYDDGIKYFSSGNISKAKESLNKSLEFSPDNPQTHRALSRINKHGEK